MKKVKTFLIDLFDAIKDEINTSKYKLAIIIAIVIGSGICLYFQYRVMINHPYIVLSSILTYLAITNIHKIKSLIKS